VEALIVQGLPVYPAALFQILGGTGGSSMRGFILAACAAFALAGCGGDSDTTANTAGIDQNLSLESAPANDTTSIDAVAGDDANLAADVPAVDNGATESNAATNADQD
jgi:hypothetical protein